MLPIARNGYFTGRGAILEALLEGLRERGRVALCGLGGVGKTQIAIEYAYRHARDYASIMWIDAGDVHALATSFGRIAERLDLPEANAEDTSVLVRGVRRWMEAREDWLAIYDNADEPETIAGFLPQPRHGHIVVTSRAQALNALDTAVAMTVPEMLPDEALAFLLHRTGRDDADDVTERRAAQALSFELGYLPLALEQAGAYIVGKQSRFEGYLHSYRRQKLSVLERAKPSFGKTAASVSTTWILAFDSLAATPASADVLRLSSALHPDSIPLELLQYGARELGTDIAEALSDVDDELLVDELLEPLTRYSLIGRNVSLRTYGLHRLVQEVTKTRMSEAERRLWGERAVRALNVVFPRADFVDWPLCERLLPSVQIALQSIEDGTTDASLQAAELFTNAGKYLFRRGQYDRAEPLHRCALNIRTRNYGTDHADVAVSFNNLGNVYFGKGQYEESQNWHERALAIRERVLGPMHLDVAASLNNVANVAYVRGDYERAKSLHQRALAIKEVQLPPNDPDIALGLDNLGNVYCDEGEYASAEELHRRALASRETTLGPEHPFVAQSLDNIANVYRKQGMFRQAEALHRRALAIHEAALGPEHHHVAESLVNLANVYRHQGKYAHAEPLAARAASIYERALGAEHPETARALNELACLYRAEGKNDEAQHLHNRALATVESGLGAGHPLSREMREEFARSARRRRCERDSLTIREREVAGLVAAGRSNRAIADALSLSERTVETHVAAILGKLHLRSRVEIAYYVLKQEVAP